VRSTSVTKWKPSVSTHPLATFALHVHAGLFVVVQNRGPDQPVLSAVSITPQGKQRDRGGVRVQKPKGVTFVLRFRSLSA